MSNVSGRVVSSEGVNTPLSGIEVSLLINGSGAVVNGITDETDDQGNFYLSGIELDPTDESGKYFISTTDETGRYLQTTLPLEGFGGSDEYETIAMIPSQISTASIPSWVWMMLIASLVVGIIYFSKTNKISLP